MKKLETKNTVLLKHNLKALKMPTMHDECEKIVARCAKENIDHLGFLLQLCEQELLTAKSVPPIDDSSQRNSRTTRRSKILSSKLNQPSIAYSLAS